MKRLTKRRKDGHAEPVRITQLVGQDIADRLADYEDAEEHRIDMNEWINAKDRLPKEGELVLCCQPYNNEMVIAWYSDISKMWFSPVFDNYVTVNYWQPLPNPPEEG